MEHVRTYFSPVGQIIWDRCNSKKLALSVTYVLALTVFALIKLEETTAVLAFTGVFLGGVAITGLALLAISAVVHKIFFKRKVEERQINYVRLPDWLELKNYYELDSLVNGKDLTGPRWSQYSCYELEHYHYKEAAQESEAFRCIKEAADAGEPQAKFKLACCYEKGIGCQHDLSKAYEVLKEAEESLNPDVLVKLGLYYRHFANNQDKAIELWEIAADGELGHPFAKMLVAEYHEENFALNPSRELAKKIITYHSQVMEHPSKIGTNSADALFCYYNELIGCINIDEYKNIWDLIETSSDFTKLQAHEIRRIIFIWGRDLPKYDDPKFKPRALVDSLQKDRKRTKNPSLNFVNEHFSLRKRLVRSANTAFRVGQIVREALSFLY